MPAKRYKVALTAAERQELSAMVNRGKSAARRLTRARILLLADEGQANGAWPDAEIAQALGVAVRTVERTREKGVTAGIAAALNHTRPQRRRRKGLDGAAEARLIQLACSEPPAGREQ